MAHLLIVDDNIDLLTILVSLLELSGHRANAARSFEEALPFLQSDPPDVAILDYHLSTRQQGLGLLEMIRSTPALAGTRVIMISGLDRSDECRSKGADGFLQKPFELDDLLAELARLGVQT